MNREKNGIIHADIEDLFKTAKTKFMRMERVYKESNGSSKVTFLKAVWRDTYVPRLTKTYINMANRLYDRIPEIMFSRTIRMEEIEYISSLACGIDCNIRAFYFISVLEQEIWFEKLDQTSVLTLCDFITNVRKLSQLAGGQSTEDLAPYDNQYEVLEDTDIIETLGLLYSDNNGLCDPANTTREEINSILADVENRFKKYPAFILLRWSYATGFLTSHSAKIEEVVNRYILEDVNEDLIEDVARGLDYSDN
jgi:hypothetical protein